MREGADSVGISEKCLIRRTELGKLIVDPKNEDLSRAFVNRMWAHFMGRGFVNPVDDLGPHHTPSNPELLDKLGASSRKAVMTSSN